MNLSSLQTVCDGLLQVGRFAGIDDPHGIFLPSDRPVARLGLALEPFEGLEHWIAAERLDALFLHRPWRLTDEQRARLQADEIGILAYHLAFDEHLTTGFNPTLAERCGWSEPELLGTKEGRPLGMICALPTLPTLPTFDDFAARLTSEFGGPLECHPPRTAAPIARAAVVGAMTDALVRSAAAAGAGVYVTGQFRQPARRAVQETGLGVVVLGHERSEVWGLHALARSLPVATVVR